MFYVNTITIFYEGLAHPKILVLEGINKTSYSKVLREDCTALKYPVDISNAERTFRTTVISCLTSNEVKCFPLCNYLCFLGNAGK